MAERLRVDGASDAYYVDRRLMAELDFELAPGSTLSKVAQDPALTWVELAAPELGEFRPVVMELNGRALSRVPIRRAGFDVGRRIFVIRPCDPSAGDDEVCPAA